MANTNDTTDASIYVLQALAIKTGDQALRRLTYAALGVDSGAGYCAVSPWVRRCARALCEQRIGATL